MIDYPVTYTYGRALLRNELIQREEEGGDPSLLEALRAEVDALEEKLPRETFAELYARIEAVPLRLQWPYEEPSDLDAIRAARPAGRRRLDAAGDLDDRVHAAWLGRAAGCLLGKPVEGWDRTQIAGYLRAVDAYPLASYIPPPAPGAVAPAMRPSAPRCLLGRIDGMPRDDDMDYPILNLTVVERGGLNVGPDDIASAWLEYLPYAGIYTAERFAYRNLVDDYPPPLSAVRFNPYREWIGAQIRGDLWGYVSPGDPERAAGLAWADASVTHTANGIYGEMFAAALVAAALAATRLDDAIDAALAEIPARSRFAEMVRNVRRWAREEPHWEACRNRIEEAYGQYHWIHTLNNAAVALMALLYSGEEYSLGITVAVMGGWDTDCNGATAGSVLGALLGTPGIPPAWTEPLHDTIQSIVIGHTMERISDLARRTRAVTERAATV